MALGEPLPKQVLGHPWLLSGDDKMSKSKGNVIYADDMVKRFGTDAVRYYLLSEMPFAQDGVITYENFMNKYNTDLANTLGNLVNRTIAMTNKYFGGTVGKPNVDFDEFDTDLRNVAIETVEKYDKLMEVYHNADACETVMNLARRCNKYIDETMPWSLAKDEASKDRLAAVMYNLLEGIRILAQLISPICPESSDKIIAQIKCDCDSLDFGAVDSYTVGEGQPLFARLDTEKVSAELAAEQKAAAKASEAEAKKAEGVTFLDEITFDEFMKIDLRACKIINCEPIKKAKKLLKLTLDDGSGKERIVASGIAKWYTPDDLIGKTVICVANLKPAVLCGVESQGMILAADAGEDDVKVVFLDGVPAGAKVR